MNRNLPLIFLLSAISPLLPSCTTAISQIVKDDQTFNHYDHVFVINSEKDPAKAAPKVKTAFEKQGFKATLVGKDSSFKESQGTGFFISDKGHIITCEHILFDMDYATVFYEGKRFYADLLKSDKELDLAILKLRKIPANKPKPLFLKPVERIS